jgi:hypothetical protein
MNLTGDIVFAPREGLAALLRRDECYVWNDRYKPDGSFSQIGGRGPDNWVLLGAPEIAFIRSIPPNDELWNWAANNQNNDRGTIYIFRDDTAHTVRWPVILISSTFTDIQHVHVLKNGLSKFGGATLEASLFDGIPYRANGDYSPFKPALHPEFWLNAWTDFVSDPPTYGPSHPMPDGRSLTFRMPLWDSASFPADRRSASNKVIGGNWVDSRIFA